VLAYVDPDNQEKVQFYINVFNRGQIMREEDIYAFLRQLNLPLSDAYTLPCDNIAIIKRVLRNLIAAYEHVDNAEKKLEVETLLSLIEEDEIM
jgi:hypothetical protein